MRLNVVDKTLIAVVAVKEASNGILKHGSLVAEGILEETFVGLVADDAVLQEAGIQVELAGSGLLASVVVDADTGVVAVPGFDGVAERAPDARYNVIAVLGIALAAAVFTRNGQAVTLEAEASDNDSGVGLADFGCEGDAFGIKDSLIFHYYTLPLFMFLICAWGIY